MHHYELILLIHNKLMKINETLQFRAHYIRLLSIK